MGIRHFSHLQSHPLRGALFENWVITELLKSQANAGLTPVLHFLRDKEGRGIDALIESGPSSFHAVEIKSGETVPSDAFRGLRFRQAGLTGQKNITPWLLYGGTVRQDRTHATVLPWRQIANLH